jgi:hypothetical protein
MHMGRQRGLIETALALRAGKLTPAQVPAVTLKKISALRLEMGGSGAAPPSGSPKPVRHSHSRSFIRRAHF